jgi:SAM-dependent methyltransferase
MSQFPQINAYYERYWSKGKDTFSGDRQGYAANFRTWMAANLEGLDPRTPILEVGCGDGTFTTELSKYSHDVNAIDISEGQITENALRFPNITFRQHDVGETFPFEDGAFGVVWCSEVLEHLFDPAFAMREIHRILRPGGRLLVTVPYHGYFKNVLIALFKFDKHYAPSNPHIRFYTKNTLSGIAREAGLSDIRMRTCGIGKPLRDLFVPTNILLNATRAS